MNGRILKQLVESLLYAGPCPWGCYKDSEGDRAEHKPTIARPLILERYIPKVLQDSPKAETSRGVRGGRGAGRGWSLGRSPCARSAREPEGLAGMWLETELLFAWILGIFSWPTEPRPQSNLSVARDPSHIFSRARRCQPRVFQLSSPIT